MEGVRRSVELLNAAAPVEASDFATHQICMAWAFDVIIRTEEGDNDSPCS